MLRTAPAAPTLFPLPAPSLPYHYRAAAQHFYFTLRLTADAVAVRLKANPALLHRYLKRCRTAGNRKCREWTMADRRLVLVYYFRFGHSISEVQRDHFPTVSTALLRKFIRRVREAEGLTHPRAPATKRPQKPHPTPCCA